MMDLQATPTAVRRARPSDRAAVLDLAARSWPEGYDLAAVWDDWLADAAGALLVGVRADDRPVALLHLALVGEDEAWLEGMRVAPEQQRAGVARTLTLEALLLARAHGVHVARLLVRAENPAARRLVEGLRFSPVAEMLPYAAPTLAADSAEARAAAPPPRVVEAGEFERLWAWLEQSNLLPLNGGLLFAGWRAQGLTEPSLRASLVAGQALLLEDWGSITALALLAPRPTTDVPLQVRYLDGSAEGIGRMAQALRVQVGARGVTLWLPNLLILRDAMDGAGYTPRTTEPQIIYARTL